MMVPWQFVKGWLMVLSLSRMVTNGLRWFALRTAFRADADDREPRGSSRTNATPTRKVSPERDFSLQIGLLSPQNLRRCACGCGVSPKP